jgi:hypothetical protein
MESPALVLAIISTVFFFATIGGLMAYAKKRSPLEGFVLGLLLGPIGIAIEARLPAWTRPEVDQGAWHSFRSLVSHQERLARFKYSGQGEPEYWPE